MAITMGELDLLVRQVGGDQVLKTLGLIDKEGQRIGAKPIPVSVTMAAGSNVTQDLAAIQGMTMSVVSAMESLTVAVAGTGLAIMDQTEALESATRAGDGFAAGKAKATSATQTLNEEIKESNALLAQQAKLIDPKDNAMVAQFRDAAAAQGEWLQQVGASQSQVLNYAGTVQQFEKRVNSATTTQHTQTQGVQTFSRELVKADGNLTSFGKKGLTTMNAVAFGISQMASSGEADLRSLAQTATTTLAFFGTKGAIASIVGTLTLGVTDLIMGRVNAARERARADQITAARADLTIQKAELEKQAAQQKFALDQGLTTLRENARERERIIAEGAAAEVEARQRQIAALQIRLAKLPLTRDRDREEAERQVTQLRAEITALGDAAQGQRAELANELLSAEKALQAQITQFENQRRDAEGQGHQARLSEIQREGDEYAKLLRKQGMSPENATSKRQEFVDALVRQANFQQASADFARLQGDLEARRLDVQNQLNAGKITQLDADRAIADIERSAVPTLTEMVDRMEMFAVGNEEALAAVRKLRVEIAGLGDTLTPLQERFFGVFNSLEQQAGASAQAAFAKIREELENGGAITIPLTLKAEALSQASAGVDSSFGNFGVNAANEFSGAFAAGISAAMTKGSGKNFFEGFGLTLLQGLGNIFVQMGSELLVYGLIMQGLLPFLINPFTSGPAAIAAGTALIAAGAALGAIAANNSGSRTGGGGGSGFGGGDTSDIVKHIWLNPDRTGPVGTETMRVPADTRPAALPRATNVNVGPVIGTNDPKAQADIVTLVQGALRAGYELGD
jgi:hypothetical protein